MANSTNFNLPVREPDDLIALRRDDLVELVASAKRLEVYIRVGHEGIATGVAAFLKSELELLAGRPAMCALCVADAEFGDVCAFHFDEACEQRKADVLEASGVRF